MSIRDLHSLIAVSMALVPTAVAAAGNTDSSVVDRIGSNATEVILTAKVTAGTARLAIMHGDESNGSDATEATSADIEVLGDESTTLSANGTLNLGYCGNKRYIFGRVVSAGGTVTQTVAITVVAGSLAMRPSDI